MASSQQLFSLIDLSLDVYISIWSLDDAFQFNIFWHVVHEQCLTNLSIGSNGFKESRLWYHLSSSFLFGRSFFQFVGDLAELKEKDYGQQPTTKRELFRPPAPEVSN